MNPSATTHPTPPHTVPHPRHHSAPGALPAEAPRNALPPVAAAAANPHWQRLGGPDAVRRLVEAFYAAMDARSDAAAIRAMHDKDLDRTKQVLVSYLTEWLGGPKTYSAERGSPMLRRRHQVFKIDAAARDAWMACMRQALAETCPDDAELRSQLDAAFYKVADFIRNTDASGDTRPHPGRPMEVNPLAVPVTHRAG